MEMGINDEPDVKSNYDSLWLGLVMGLLVPSISATLYFSSKIGKYSFADWIEYSRFIHVLPQILSLCILPNLAVFFLFIWRNHNVSAKGVLIATIICAAIVLGIKIFS